MAILTVTGITAPVAWTTCIIGKPTSRLLSSSSRQRQRQQPCTRRPRRSYILNCDTERTNSTIEDNNPNKTQSVTSTPFTAPPHLSQQTPDSSSSSAPAPPPIPPSLLVDSVLETKWKNERDRNCAVDEHEQDHHDITACCDNITAEQQQQGQHMSNGTHDSTTDADNGIAKGLASDSSDIPYPDDLIASDPYKAFAKFTRMAAPRAAIGRPSSSSTIRKKSRNSTNSFLASQYNSLSSPSYSMGDIGRRLIHYAHAQRNLRDFIAWFIGDFDNYAQISMERARGVYPGEGGGHEHIHCRIRLLPNQNDSEDILFATYYFNGDPTKVFRTRIYSVQAREPCCERGIIEMRILRLFEEKERQLASVNWNPDKLDESWDINDDTYEWLRGCEVYWERYCPSISHQEHEESIITNQLGIATGDRFIGYMNGGGCELHSKSLGGKIRILDDLLLTKDDLWVADRGFDTANQFVYGNRRGIPYKMKRVYLHDTLLSWTLSDSTARPPHNYIP